MLGPGISRLNICGWHWKENLSFDPAQGVSGTPEPWPSSPCPQGCPRVTALQVMQSPLQRCPLLPAGAGAPSGHLGQGTTASRAPWHSQAIVRVSSKLGAVQGHQ